jgi:predicted esterase
MDMNNSLLKTLLTSIAFSVLSAGQLWALDCVEKEDYFRCDTEVVSQSLKSEKIPVFIYISSKVLKAENEDIKPSDLEYILFLHGRGYARNMGAEDSMLEHLNIKKILNDPQYENLIFVAPQDVILQSDSRSIGQDYWIGAGGRDWISFLSDELPSVLQNAATELDIQAKLSTVMGISMGAHGALMLGQSNPELYKNVIALSPIFRSTPEEISDSDRDVFLKAGEPMLEEYNFGTKLLNQRARLSEHFFIEISRTDFGLDAENFPTGASSWSSLKDLMEENDHTNHIEISDDDRGHSHHYWKDVMLRSLNWHKSTH